MRLDRKKLNATLFKKNKEGQVVCLVDDIIVHISKRYEGFSALHIEQHVTTLGVFNLKYNGEDYGCTIPLILTMSPTLIDDEEIEGEDFLKLTFKKDDVFMHSTTLVQRTDLVFALFKLFVFFGLRYPFMKATNTSIAVFRNFFLTGFGMDYTDSGVWSAIFSELNRKSKTEVDKLWRLEPKGDGYAIGMKHIALTASKLTTKLSGSYLNDTLHGALTTENKQNSEIEDLLRR